MKILVLIPLILSLPLSLVPLAEATLGNTLKNKILSSWVSKGLKILNPAEKMHMRGMRGVVELQGLS